MAAKILFICGSLNEAELMHKIYMHLFEYNSYLSPFYEVVIIPTIRNKKYEARKN